tara:strand:+ start:679 stop:831 length:153 start_codon:yes stop_codon:yes gene_type:complete
LVGRISTLARFNHKSIVQPSSQDRNKALAAVAAVAIFTSGKSRGSKKSGF